MEVPEASQHFEVVATFQELPEDGFKAVELQGVSILIGRARGKVFAWKDRCPHAGAPLRIGKCRLGELKCAWHGWVFDLETGATVPEDPAFHLTAIPLKIDGDRVLVAV